MLFMNCIEAFQNNKGGEEEDCILFLFLWRQKSNKLDQNKVVQKEFYWSFFSQFSNEGFFTHFGNISKGQLNKK